MWIEKHKLTKVRWIALERQAGQFYQEELARKLFMNAKNNFSGFRASNLSYSSLK